MEEKDLNDLVKKLDEKRKNHWYSDPDKSKKYGPILETLVWIMGMAMFISILVVVLIITSGPNNFVNDTTSPILIENMDCYSLQQTLLDLNHKSNNVLEYSHIITSVKNEITGKCLPTP